MLKFLIFLLIFANSFCKSEDVFYTINSKKILHKVSDKFLSISIDPAVLLAGVNLSDASLILAKHLSPAYIRLAGPSTPFVKYLDNEELLPNKEQGGKNVYVTPSTWFGINEWFNLARLTPVFGINDGDNEKGVWDPKSTLPLLEMSDKFDVTCYWQLGYGCSNKTTTQYVEDLNILKQTLNGFPEHNSTWKIVGSDMSSCMSDAMVDDYFDSYMRDLDENVDAVIWGSSLVPKTDLGFTKAALWASIPKDRQPVTFSSAIKWAVQVGQAATLEYDVIFREPRLLEFTKDTPVYWFSFLYKKLMGANVLEIRSTNENPDMSTFAHCTRRQNDFVRSGAVTILMVNNGSETGTANIRLGNILLDKSMEVQSYFLRASNESASKVLLNDQPLSMEILRKPDGLPQPILRRAKIRTHISLEIPAESVAFFVLTGAKYNLCSNNKEDLSAILQEINEDQDVSLPSEEGPFNIEGRRQETGNGDIKVSHKTTLEDIKRNILKEIELDKSYYNKPIVSLKNKNVLKKEDKEGDSYKREMLHKHLRMFIEKSKKNDLKTGINSKKDKPALFPQQPNSLHLTIQEIENILKQRAKAKAAAKKIKLTSSELDMLVDKATLKIPRHFVTKRDINRLLLEERANFYKNTIFNQEMFEEHAKEKKMFPKYKFRRSHQVERPLRSINTQLLHLKAIMEENKNYLLNRNKQLQKAPLRRVARDINLDLLKRRSEPDSQFGQRNKVIVQPNLKKRKLSFLDKGREKYAPISLDGEPSEDLFEDLTRFEERLLEDFASPKHPFAEWDIGDLKGYETGLFKKPTTKPKTPFGTGIFATHRPQERSKSSIFDSDEYFQLLKSSGEEFDVGHAEEEPYVDEIGIFMPGSKYGKKKSPVDLWGLKSTKKGIYDGSQSQSPLCPDFGDFNLSEDENYGFFRKKRSTSTTITKAKLRTLKKDVKSQVRKIKQQLKEDKTKYIKEKIKKKTESIKQKHADHSGRKHKTNIQIIPNNHIIKESNSTITKIIANANSKENMLEHNIEKRSLLTDDLSRIFGQYKPLSPTLNAWKPSDILNLHKNRFPNWPVYSWVQDQNLRNALFQNNYLKPFGLRKRRYISDNSSSFTQNGIIDKDSSKNSRRTNDSDDHLETATNKDVRQPEMPRIKEKMIAKKKISYLERVLEKKTIKPVLDLFHNIKHNLKDVNGKVKQFFSDIF